MKKKTWFGYYENHKLKLSNLVLHFPYLLKIISYRPSSILEIGCGPADHSMFLKRIFGNLDVSLLDSEKSLLDRNRVHYGDKINRSYNIDVLDSRRIASLPKFDLVISQGLMEHFDDKALVKIINNFSNKAKTMIFSVPSDEYQNKDFGNEILRSRTSLMSLLQKEIKFKSFVNNYFDIGFRTKFQLIKKQKLSFEETLRLLFLKSCHLLIEIRYE